MIDSVFVKNSSVAAESGLVMFWHKKFHGLFPVEHNRLTVKNEPLRLL
jgi:hypothetical protein